jgi:hypothetical protein
MWELTTSHILMSLYGLLQRQLLALYVNMHAYLPSMSVVKKSIDDDHSSCGDGGDSGSSIAVVPKINKLTTSDLCCYLTPVT